MRLLLALWLAVLALTAPALAESRLVQAEGKNFVAPDGSVLHIKGISLGNWLMPEGYMFKFEVAKSPRQIFAAFERLLGPVVGWAKAAGLYVIVDLHAAPGGQTGINHDDGPGYPVMFYVPRDRDLTVKLWQAIAQRYAGDPTILGYDLLNEPIAPYHDIATLNPRLEPFYKRVTEAVREVDPG